MKIRMITLLFLILSTNDAFSSGSSGGGSGGGPIKMMAFGGDMGGGGMPALLNNSTGGGGGPLYIHHSRVLSAQNVYGEMINSNSLKKDRNGLISIKGLKKSNYIDLELIDGSVLDLSDF